MKINMGYIDFNGKRYDNLKEIAITREEKFECFGKSVAIPKDEDSDFLGDRFYIFQDNNDSNKAYKVNVDFGNYKNFINYQYCHSSFEIEMISKLIDKQPNIKRTDFPTGILTIDNYMVGSEIVYYPESITLSEYCKKEDKQGIIPEKIYLNALLSLKEMKDNDIYYLDIHGKNFVILDNSDDVKVIDFQTGYIRFEKNDAISKQINNNLQKFLNDCNNKLGINEHIVLNEEKPIEDAIEKVMVLGQRYR